MSTEKSTKERKHTRSIRDIKESLFSMSNRLGKLAERLSDLEGKPLTQDDKELIRIAGSSILKDMTGELFFQYLSGNVEGSIILIEHIKEYVLEF